MQDKSLLFISALTILASSSATFAETLIVDVKKASTITIEVDSKPQTKTESILTGDFGIQTNQVLEDVGEVVGNQYFGELNINYKSVNSSDTHKEFDLRTRVNDEEQLMFSVTEAHAEFSFKSSQLIVGRKKLDWSGVDAKWGLGKINNRINFDYLNPGQEGLTGLLYKAKLGKGFSLDMFGSFVYIPELNPGMKINNDEGTVECQNPWCTAPDASAPVEGKNIPIYYNVNYPTIEEVVNRQSFGMNLNFNHTFDFSEAIKDKNDEMIVDANNLDLNLNVFYMRKPENKISVSAEIKYKNEDGVIFVDATPEIYYHDVRGGNLTLDLPKYDLALYGSFISVAPNEYPDGNTQYIEYTGIKPNKKQEDYISSGMTYDNGDLKITGGYIARVSEFDRESDILVEYPRWNQALNFAVSKNLTRKFHVEFDYKFDMLTEDRITMFNTSYRFGPNIVASLGFNVIGTSSSQESFWSQYENNDSVYSSMKYKF
jgi:hypothetical protein